ARGVDRGDSELLLSLYHPDAVDDHGGPELLGTQAGRFGGPRQPVQTGHTGQHFMGNITIDVEGNKAYAETYTVSYMPSDHKGDPYVRMRGLRYVDRFEDRGDGWKIAYRVVVDDWDFMGKWVEKSPMSEQWRRGTRDQKDPLRQFKKGEIADREKQIRDRLQS